MEQPRLRVYLGNLTSEIAFYLPYTAGVLRAHVESDPEVAPRVEFPAFFFHSLNGVEELAESVDRPNVLGLSLYVWNERRSLKLTRLIKQKFPECLVVLGGPQVPKDSAAFMRENPDVDILVHHEGEGAFLEVLRETVRGSRDWDRIAGMTFRRGTEVVQTGAPKFLKSLELQRSPYLSGYFDDCFKEAESLGRSLAAVIETNRGCPYSCTYCDWGNNIHLKLRNFSRLKVESEIDYVASRAGEVYVADANFGILPRDAAFAERLAKRSVEGGRLRTVQVIMAKQKNDRTREISRMLSRQGLMLLGETIGLQTLTPSVLQNVKRSNLPLPDLRRLLSDYERDKIDSYVELILGLPGETEESFLRTLDTVWEARAPDVRVYNLLLLSNSELAEKSEREKYGLITSKVKIIEGREGEDEFAENVIGSKDLPVERARRLRKLVLFMDVLHGGKWLYFVAWYLQRDHGVTFTEFYRRLMDDCRSRGTGANEPLSRLAADDFLRAGNSGFFNRFVGPHNPHGVDWQDKFFFKQTYNWLCLSENRERLYEEAGEFLRRDFAGVPDEILDDLLKFQAALMYSEEDRMGHERQAHFRFAWPSYFRDSAELLRQPTKITLTGGTVGKHRTAIDDNTARWMFEAGGGAHFDKINRFVHREFQESRL